MTHTCQATAGNSKSQIPNTKEISESSSQIPTARRLASLKFESLRIGIHLEFGFWFLEFFTHLLRPLAPGSEAPSLRVKNHSIAGHGADARDLCISV